MMGMTLPNSTFKNGLNISLKILKAHYKRRKKKKKKEIQKRYQEF